ncbi:MAG: hypothetical protein HYX76_05780 [Acidobacteria bacterium]|nr:hypothetical protein [Acidobacteriota bacterium]
MTKLRVSSQALVSARNIFGVIIQRNRPGPAGGSASKSIRQIPPFLN